MGLETPQSLGREEHQKAMENPMAATIIDPRALLQAGAHD
jgi:hypothetical protein